jgi:hypothetical protein
VNPVETESVLLRPRLQPGTKGPRGSCLGMSASEWYVGHGLMVESCAPPPRQSLGYAAADNRRLKGVSPPPHGRNGHGTRATRTNAGTMSG